MKNSILKSYFKKFIKSEAFVSVIIVFVLAIGIIGTSYALYMDVDEDTEYQLVKVGDLSIGFDNGENVFQLNYLTPTEDDIATGKIESDVAKEISENNLFSFYIYNNGSYTANYNIKLIPQEGTISSEYLRYQICKDNIENCKDINNLSEIENNVIYVDELSPNRTETETNPSAYYFLRVWISSDYADKVKENDKVVLKVEIDAKNASGYLDNDNTLAGRLLSDSRVKINNTVPSFTGIADYVVTGDATSGELGLFKAPDDYGISYYYRGAQSYNYVNFAGLTWRVVRINGDGSIRLILEGTLDSVSNVTGDIYNNHSKNNAYAGYMYGLALTNNVDENTNRCLVKEYESELNSDGKETLYEIAIDKITDLEYDTKEECEAKSGKWTTNSYEATHANVISSQIKSSVDLFYSRYIKNSNDNLEKYLADTLFCNDKSLADKKIGDSNTGLGFGTNPTYYAASERLRYSEGTTPLTVAKPSLKCAENDLYNYSRFTSKLENSTTLPNGTPINNDLLFPIGLLSEDELVLAGAWISVNNEFYFLNDAIKKGLASSVWRIGTPHHFSKNNGFVNIFFAGAKVTENGTSYNYYSMANDPELAGKGVRPVINLRADVLYKSGDGTSETPYEIK